MATHSTIDISLQGREYRVTCAPEERESLLAAVAYVEAKMNEIAAKTRGSGERLAVMTALNLAHELLEKPSVTPVETAPVAPLPTSDASFDTTEIGRRIDDMVARLDAAMAPQESLL